MNKILIIIVEVLALLLSGCGSTKASKAAKPEKIDSDQILFTAKSSNWGCVNNAEDYHKNSFYTVYYNGRAEYYDVYNLSGEKGNVGWDLSDDEYSDLVKLLNGDFQEEDKDNDGCDGTGWKMSYYNQDGTVNHEFSGYIYDHKVLEDIIDIASLKEE